MSIESMVLNIQSEIGNIPKALIRKEIFRAARYFCSQTAVVKESVSVTIPAGSDLIAIPNPSDQLMTLSIQVIEELRSSQYSQPEYGQLAVKGSPSTDLDLTITVSCRPSPSATTLPDILNYWDQALEAGALYELYKKPKKEWTDLNMAVVKKAELDSYVHDAKQQSAQGAQAGSRRQKLRNFT